MILRKIDWLIGLSILTLCSSCGPNASRGVQALLPSSALARGAVESALGAWRDAPELPATASPAAKLIFVDQQRPQKQRLRSFTVLNESESEGCRRFQVKLYLAEPEESRVATYCVFGEDPIWVYRSEQRHDHALGVSDAIRFTRESRATEFRAASHRERPLTSHDASRAERPRLR